jgi:pimeloyl-ACP methyl ester carboxylesterase
MNVYFISGMGADRRLFKHIRLPDGFHMNFVEWIAPLDNEKIPEYASRLVPQIDTSHPFMLVGVSLGGIVAVEIAKRFHPVATVIIGSIPIAAHLPRYYAFGQSLGLLDLLPGSFFKKASSAKRLFTLEKKEDKELLRQIIRDGSADFIKWAMKAVIKWENKEMPQPLWHIHGTSDEVFPIRLTRPSHTIRRAGHLLIMTHAEEVNAILRDILQPISLPL